MDTTTMTAGGIMPVFGGYGEREPASFSFEVKRRDWNLAGTAYYSTAEAFNLRVLRSNKRRIAGLKRALWADSKANRKAYGTASANFKYTPAPSDSNDSSLPPWTAAWPTAVLAAVEDN